MAEPITISKLDPPLDSMNYAQLRELGLSHIQRLSGKIWSDNNAHDPGITILEVLAYAITDLGYRTNYDIRDILAPKVPGTDIKNFFTAAQILPNCPVTFNDYRKLLMDVEVEETIGANTIRYGVKNAWIYRANENERPFYVNVDTKSLSYNQLTPDAQRIIPNVMYDVLLEFDENETYDDMNSNVLSNIIVIQTGTFKGMRITIDVEFPRWDTSGIDWENHASILPYVNAVTMNFSRVPNGIHIDSTGIDSAGQVWISAHDNTVNNNPVNTSALVDEINLTIYGSSPNYTGGMLDQYLKKVAAVNRILAAVRATMMANRNLCEDFFRLKALKVEEIALCADIDIRGDADVETVQAAIYHQIEQFLSPTIYFHSLTEMLDKGYTTDKIFEGPFLQHGFIDDAELQNAESKKVIHVSDLISIIMDIPGVLAVRKIQIANIPLDNDDAIPTKTVRWCLDLAFDKFYVPRLSIARSRMTYYKDHLPYIADELEAQEKLDALEATDRLQKLYGVQNDMPIPQGEYADIDSYYSIQNDFPLLYGIGDAGLPGNVSNARKNQAKQLKAFLLFFDQMLANYLSQLAHVKELFSFDGTRQINGQFTVDKTYFSQSLINLVPDAAPLYFHSGTVLEEEVHEANLQAMTENEAGFEVRRNLILDHLAARFGESFTDYAMLLYNMDGKKATEELLEDKLEFLNHYPLLSTKRGQGFNYLDPSKLWHIDNTSGLARRVHYLVGIDPIPTSTLSFTPRLAIDEVGMGLFYRINIYDVPASTDPTLGIDPVIMQSVVDYATKDEARLALELLVVNGAQPHQYRMAELVGSTWVPVDPYAEFPTTALLVPVIVADNEVIGFPPSTNVLFGTPTSYSSRAIAQMQVDAYRAIVQPLLEHDYVNRVSANRANLACDFELNDVVRTSAIPIDEEDFGPCPIDRPQWYYVFDLMSPDGMVDILTRERMLAEVPQGTETNSDVINTHFANVNVGKRMQMLRTAASPSFYDFVWNPIPDLYEVPQPTPSSTPFIVLRDRCNDIRGLFTTTLPVDFMSQLNAASSIKISGSQDNDGTYLGFTADYDAAEPKLIVVNVPSTYIIDTSVANGNLIFTVPSNIIAVSPSLNAIDVNVDFVNYADEDFKIKVTYQTIPLNATVSADLTVVSVQSLGGGTSRVFIREPLPVASFVSNMAVLYMQLPIVEYRIDSSTSTNAFVVDFTPYDRFVAHATGWVFDTFFNREGMHVVEHLLLRPKSTITELYPISSFPLVAETVSSTKGQLVFARNLSVVDVNLVDRTFEITGLFEDELLARTDIRIVSSTGNDGYYTVRSATNNVSTTTVSVYEAFYSDVNDGEMQYWLRYNIDQINVGNNSVSISDAIHAPSGFANIVTEVVIEGADPKSNNGRFLIATDPVQSGNQYTFKFASKRVPLLEEFLPIDLEAECKSCVVTDPYSHIATVVLPGWAGRFIDQNFRRFVERTLRLEAPAHVMLNVCWVSCEAMAEFERAWRIWLVQNTIGPNRPEYTHAHEQLLATIDRLRSVYPAGTLHDCDTDNTSQQSVILNNSNLGTL